MVITLIEQSIGKASLRGQSPLTYKCTSPNINIEASHPAKIRRSGFTVHNPNEKTYDNTIRQSVIGYTDHVMWPTIAKFIINVARMADNNSTQVICKKMRFNNPGFLSS